MKIAVQLTPESLSRFETLAFAGGGNRCLWQGGLMEAWLAHGLPLPRQMVGTSAGAAVAAACLGAGPKAARNACLALYAKNKRVLHWPAASQEQVGFAHRWIYPAWLASFVSPEYFDAIRR